MSCYGNTWKTRERFPEAKPRIISNNGPQFACKDFKEFIRESGFRHVRTRPYYPQSNGKLERFHATIKNEEIRRNSYLSIDDARKHIAGYIDYDNCERLNSAIHYLPPQDVLQGRTAERLAERRQKLADAKKARLAYREAVA